MASNELDSLIAGLDSGKPSSSGANPKSEKGHYFIDQNTGQYYYQTANDADSMAIENNVEDHTSNSPSNNATNNIPANDNQVVLNTGGDQYQTVTIGIENLNWLLCELILRTYL